MRSPTLRNQETELYLFGDLLDTNAGGSWIVGHFWRLFRHFWTLWGSVCSVWNTVALYGPVTLFSRFRRLFLGVECLNPATLVFSFKSVRN